MSDAVLSAIALAPLAFYVASSALVQTTAANVQLWLAPGGVAGPGAVASGLCFVDGSPVHVAQGTKPIEEIRVGQRVLSRGGTSDNTAVNEQTWRLVEVRMANPDASADEIELTLLRPLDWIAATGAEPGATIAIAIEEMGLLGPGQVVHVAACPVVESGPGEVVTATISHLNGYVLQLGFAETQEVLEVTGPHPLFSVDRNDWVAAQELAIGERVVTRGGELTVASVEQLGGLYRVWNLEVEDAHTYFVGADSIWAHNGCAETARGLGEFGQRTIGNFVLKSRSMLQGSTFVHEIKVLANTGSEAGRAQLVQLARVLECEAAASGAESIIIRGVDVINPYVLRLVGLGRTLGYTVSNLTENSITFRKSLVQ